MNLPLTCLLVVFSAFSGCFRRWMLASFDEAGLPLPLSLETLAMPALLLVAVLVFFLLARRLPAQRTLCAGIGSYFRVSDLSLLAIVGGCFFLIGSFPLALAFGETDTLALVQSALLAVGAVCLLVSVAALRKKKYFPGVLLLVPVCALVLRLIFFYRDHTADPVLRNYYVELLALAAFTVFLLEFAAFAFRGGAPRLFVPLGCITVVLCVAAAIGSSLFGVFGFDDFGCFVGAAFTALGLLFSTDFDP